MTLFIASLSFDAAGDESSRPKGDVWRGKTEFTNKCLQCHDVDGTERKNGPSLQGLKSGKLRDGREATHDRLLEIINTGPGYMPAFKHYISEQQKEDIVAYMMAL